MPRVNGLELIQKIRRLDPGVKVIYMSGDFHPYSALLEEEMSRYRVSILPKPFSREDLLHLLVEFAAGAKGVFPIPSIQTLRPAE